MDSSCGQKAYDGYYDGYIWREKKAKRREQLFLLISDFELPWRPLKAGRLPTMRMVIQGEAKPCFDAVERITSGKRRVKDDKRAGRGMAFTWREKNGLPPPLGLRALRQNLKMK